MQPVVALGTGIIIYHLVIATHGQLSSLRIVAKNGYQRVVFFNGLGNTAGNNTGSRTVADLHIIVVEPLPFVQLQTHDAQQVVTKHLTVLAALHQRFIVIGLDLGQ